MMSLMYKMVFLFLTMSAFLLSSCKEKEPSVLKVFVRSASNTLQAGAKVVVIGDLQSNPPTKEHVDTLVTNESGFVAFDMDKYFNNSGGETTGYFDIIVKKDAKEGAGYVRCRKHITTVETIFFPN
jgi:hypothetical protein